RGILGQMSEAGVLWLLLTGGEVFARHDFLDIYRYAKQQGFLITLFTNGTMITESIADALAADRPFNIEITLYGATRETYEALTRIPGSYDRCMRGIRLLLERNLPLKLKTVAVSINRHEVFAMQQMAGDLGVEFKFDSMINPRIDCSSSPLAVRLSPAELVELDLQDPRRMAEWKSFADQFLGPVKPPEKHDEIYHCGGGINSFAIDPDGKMTICVLSHQDTYDLRRGSLREGWDHFLYEVRAKKATRPTKCSDCTLKAICGMCPANGELEAGDPEEPVDFLCQTAHLRAAVFDFPVAVHGDCEYCSGGEHHRTLQATALALREKGDEWSAHAALLPSFAPASTGCASGACSGCGVSGKQLD
ncbi:MAG TPA: radical SAM protein, partial [Thermoanaerobaculia bacterium]|nr:radical SAM protein [Thermoanaerobaculia bacterium]